MDPNGLFFVGVLSGVLSLSAYVVYLAMTIRRIVRPQRTSWIIWAVLSSIAFVSVWSEGAGPWLWFTGAQAGGTVLVALVSIPLGAGRFVDRREALVLMTAGLGLGLWYLTADPAWALAVSVAIGALAGLVTVVNAFHQPLIESMEMWLVSWIAAAGGIVSVGAADWVLLAYPLYLFILYGAILLAMLAGRARLARRTPNLAVAD